MADLASSAVSVIRSFTENKKTERVTRVLKITGLAQGSTTNKILASALGFQRVEQCSNAVKSDNASIYVAAPAADGSYIVLASLAQATDANRDDPADISADVYITVRGTPA